MAIKKKKFDWERLIFRVFGVCLGIIFAAYISVGPRWICRSLQNLRAQEATPSITAHWQTRDLLIVQASPGSLYLTGGYRDDQYVGQGLVTLPTGNVSIAYAPQLREAIVLKDSSGLVIAQIAIPERPPEVFTVILPLIDRP